MFSYSEILIGLFSRVCVYVCLDLNLQSYIRMQFGPLTFTGSLSFVGFFVVSFFGFSSMNFVRSFFVRFSMNSVIY